MKTDLFRDASGAPHTPGMPGASSTPHTPGMPGASSTPRTPGMPSAPGAAASFAAGLRVAAPAPPAPAQPYSFPIMATVAPVVVSLAIWFVTKSPFALVFAALGPAVAVASLADARVQSRRRLRRENSRFRSELEATKADIDAAHDRERAELGATLPSAVRLVSGEWPPSERWLCGPDDPVAVGVGAGVLPSAVTLEGVSISPRSRDPAQAEIGALVDAAARLTDAPIVVDARLGIGIAGPRVLAAAVARGLLLQVMASVPPDAHRVEVETDDPGAWSWLDALPHRCVVLPGDEPTTVVRVRGRSAPAGTIVVGIAESPRMLPPGTRVVVEVRGLDCRIDQHPDRARTGPLVAHPVSLEQAITVARELTQQAERGGAVEIALPHSVRFDECGDRTVPGDGGPGTLAAVVAATARAPLVLDLVRHGPHAIVGGTTGSGKSELLTAWILAIANDHSPAAASVLLVDFKGGSAFAALATLPHCVGMITDLDEAGAQRALESLAAELRRREKHLARSGAKSIDALSAADRLARLVIVVDEFAAMVSGFPDLHALFADIAARGRSLGVHLVLCTQRPAGVIRDAVLANSALRLSLRVNNSADSRAVVGTDDAASLPVEPRGRALVGIDGDEPVLAQFPLVTQSDIDAVAARWSAHSGRPHRPWLDPLPSRIPLEAVRSAPHDGIPFGLLDDPSNQAQPVADYRPEEHGNLLVVGAGGSGKSTVLSALAASATVLRLPGDVEGAWDVLAALADEQPAAQGGSAAQEGAARLVLIDDLDALLARFPEEYESAVVDLITRCLREGPARGVHCAITAQRITPVLHPVASLCGSRLLLRLPNRQEHVLAGGDGADFVERLPPGAGHWRGLRLQVATAATVPVPGPDPEFEPEPAVAVVVAAPAAPATQTPSPHPPPARALSATARVIDSAAPLAVVTARPVDFVARLRLALPEYARPGAVVPVGPSIPSPVGPATTSPADPVGVSGGAPAPVSGGGGGAVRAVVGDVDAWQSQWGSLAAARSSHTVIVDGCTASEFRAVTRLRALPPVLDPRGDAFWMLTPDGTVHRARLPHQ